jgi:type VI secretion system protein ImpH
MASSQRSSPDDVIFRLLDAGHRFSFFQAVTLLERTAATGTSVGGAGPPSKEAVRFSATPSMGFPATDVTDISLRSTNDPASGEERNDRYRVEASFLGLYGPASPLPSFFTEAVISPEGDTTVPREFLDLFNNRLLGLVYRAWKRYRHHVSFQNLGDDELSRLVLCLIGLATADPPGREAPTRSLLPYAGAMGLYCHSASLLESIVRFQFPGVSAQVEEWVRRDAIVVDEQKLRLGIANCALGEETVLGDRVADIGGKFRLWLGPLPFDLYQSFLPGMENRLRLDELTAKVVRERLINDVVLVARSDDVPEWKLGDCAKLGHTSWLGEPSPSDTAIVFAGSAPA